MNYMTVDEFISWVRGYYVPYNQVQEAEVRGFLSKKSDEFIDALKTEVMHTFSGQYKTPPDIAILVGCSSRAYDYVRTHRPKALQIEDEIDYSEEVAEVLKNLKHKLRGKKSRKNSEL